MPIAPIPLSATREAPLVIWRVVDGKPGHDNQTRGLARALARRVAVADHEVPAPGAAAAAALWLTGRGPAARATAPPALVLGAGRRTHPGVLAAARAHGARSVVLMRPSLPAAWFDLVVVPAHDGVAGRDNVLVTRGVLNCVTASGAKDPSAGLVLLGGPSRHHGWDDAAVAARVAAIAAREDRIGWSVASSRRTPPGTLRAVAAAGLANVRVVPHEETGPDWLPDRLARAAVVWVSEDSASMIHESLSAGAATGLIDVPRRRSDRVTRGVDGLLREGLVTPFAAWREGAPLAPPPAPLDEAGRCAGWIHERWLAPR